MPSARQEVPACPRCGYDLSGIIATWDDCCPTSGTCSECGMTLDWRDVFFPHRADLSGFVEHARGPLRTWLTAWLTAWWTLRPWSFWRRVQPSQRTVPRRMALWLVIVLLLPHVLASSSGVMSYFIRSKTPMPVMYAPGRGGTLTPVPAPVTMLAPPVDGTTVLSHFAFPIASAQSTGSGPLVRIVVPGWPWYALPALAFTLAWPALWLVLPTTRTQSKLRWSHVARAAVYQCSWISVVTLFRLFRNLYTSFELATSPMPANLGVPRLGDYAPELLGIALLVWLAGWWFYAITRGWAVKRGVVVWLSLCIAAGLFAVAVGRWDDVLTAWETLLGTW